MFRTKARLIVLFDTVLERFGTVDVLVNNAGLINVERHFLEADEAWWDRVLSVNLKSVFLCSSPRGPCDGPSSSRRHYQHVERRRHSLSPGHGGL